MNWKLIDRLLLPSIFFLGAMLAALVMWVLLLFHQRAEVQASTKDQLTFVKAKTEAELRERILPLTRLAIRWQSMKQPDDAEMELEAGLVTTGYPAYRTIEWLDPAFRVLWATSQTKAPPDLGEALSAQFGQQVRLGSVPNSEGGVIAELVNVEPASRSLLVIAPVYSKSQFRGMLAGMFSNQELFSSILQNVAEGYSIAIYDGKNEIYDRDGSVPPSDGQYAEESDIYFQGMNWQVRVWPKAGTPPFGKSPLPQVALIGGLLMAALLAVTAYVAETARMHARETVKANKELTKEIAGREKAEEALRLAQKMEAVGRLAGGVAHDFNNLLMVIRGHAALMRNGVGVNDPMRRELDEVLRTTDRASTLTRQLLAFSRKQVLQLRVLDLNTLVGQVAGLLPPVLGEDIDLVLKLDPQAGRVKADYAQMEQVLMNLVFNARDAMPNGGELTIETSNRELSEEWVRAHEGSQAGEHVMLAVRDTGQGMNEDIQSHIFEPFFTTKDRTKGTGLGLATAYGTVRQSGGCISVRSNVGEGTTIEIFLPRVEAPVEVEEATPAADPSMEGAETVLVVEDDDAVRRMTREFLKIKGYVVIEARSAAEAIRFMEKEELVDLVLTDVLMPGMKGRELIERLSVMRPGIKALYMSAYTEDAAINIGVLNPGTEFIEKPFSPDDLARKVRKVLGASRNGLSSPRAT